MQNRFIVGERLYLRALTKADAPVLVRYLGDPDVWQSLALERPPSLEEEEQLIERVATSREERVFGVSLRTPERLLGAAGLQLADGAGQFGIFIGDRAEWDKGYGTEATSLVLQYAFETLGLCRVWLEVLDDNARGIRAYEKVGFRAFSVRRRAVCREGRYRDLVAMAILREEWKAGFLSS